MECEVTLHLDQEDLTLAEPAKQYSNDDDGNPNPWITVLPRHLKYRSYDTKFIKITDGLNLKETSHPKIGQAITLVAQFTPVREGPNLIATNTYCPSAKRKLLRLTSINIDGVNKPASTYLAMGRDQRIINASLTATNVETNILLQTLNARPGSRQTYT
ncbi:hypothetical protein HPB47_027925 [Ixodes persulcatus]|uniref:Uncharacterized protein n=1 Tax=Ixodes persulcatus TaxID=34615 RepID=A0AC60PUS9_IXOPE|nr:hypothetical protein HPB47_027925 [Ixodes persulcatus]